MPNPDPERQGARGGAGRLGRAEAAEPGRHDLGAAAAPAGTAPITDGPVSHVARGDDRPRHDHRDRRAVRAAARSAAVGWSADPGHDQTRRRRRDAGHQFPAIAMVGVLVGFGCVIGLYFRPHVGQVPRPDLRPRPGLLRRRASPRATRRSRTASSLQAAGATLAVFAVMLVLYRTQIIKVTDRFRRIVIFATLGIMVFYGVSFVITLFGGERRVHQRRRRLFGIGFSVFVCVLAAMNLALDFDFIERGAKAGLAKDYEWFAAFGLLVTIVWLYLEILRLLAKLRSR